LLAVLKFVKIVEFLRFLRFVKLKFTNYAYCSSHFDWRHILTCGHQLHILWLWQKFDVINLLVKIHNIQLIISIGYHSVYNNVYLWTKNLTVINKLARQVAYYIVVVEIWYHECFSENSQHSVNHLNWISFSV